MHRYYDDSIDEEIRRERQHLGCPTKTKGSWTYWVVTIGVIWLGLLMLLFLTAPAIRLMRWSLN